PIASPCTKRPSASTAAAPKRSRRRYERRFFTRWPITSASVIRDWWNSDGRERASRRSMTTPRHLTIPDDRSEGVAAIDSIASGHGWCNVVPKVVEDLPDLKVNVLGLWLNAGVPVASFVTMAPRRGEAQPSSLGLLHSHG